MTPHDLPREPSEAPATGKGGHGGAPRNAVDEAVRACQAAHGDPHALLALTGLAHLSLIFVRAPVAGHGPVDAKGVSA